MAKNLTTSSRVEVDRFDGEGDFGLWKIRMLAHFGILGLKKILLDPELEKGIPITKAESKKPEAGDASDVTATPLTKVVLDTDKLEQNEKAMGLIITNVSDHVLRKIKHCKTAAAMWSLLDRLYTESSLPNRIHLQLRLYTFKMIDAKSINENVDDFLKIVAELGVLDIAVSDEVQAILLLTSLSPKFDSLKHTLKYGRESLTLEEVISAAKSREREISEALRDDRNPAVSLYVKDRGRTMNRGYKGPNGRSRSRSNSNTRVTCWFCKKEGHMKKDCYVRKKKYGEDEQGEAGVIIERLAVSEALSMHDAEAKEKWVIDSGCTYHMTSRRD